MRDLAYVGKTRIIERREVFCPLTTYDKKALSRWLIENAQENEWVLNPYLDSRDSTTSVDGGTILRYSVLKYTETPQAEQSNG
ncbi:MAG: hypothetical protein ACRCWJ_14925 [Casimicrobium sp.]